MNELSRHEPALRRVQCMRHDDLIIARRASRARAAAVQRTAQRLGLEGDDERVLLLRRRQLQRGHMANLIEESVPVLRVVVIVGVGVAQVFAFELKGDVFRRRGFELHQQRP